MSVLFVVIPLALVASAVAVFAFVWALQRGQLDDLTTPAHRMLEDDEMCERALPGAIDRNVSSAAPVTRAPLSGE